MITSSQIHEFANTHRKNYETDRIGYYVRWERRNKNGELIVSLNTQIEIDVTDSMTRRDAMKLAKMMQADGHTGIMLFRNILKNGDVLHSVRINEDSELPTQPVEPVTEVWNDQQRYANNSLLALAQTAIAEQTTKFAWILGYKVSFNIGDTRDMHYVVYKAANEFYRSGQFVVALTVTSRDMVVYYLTNTTLTSR